MVIKIKVSDIAKDFNKSSKEIVEIIANYCEGPAKKPSSVLSEDELNILFDKITQDNSVKSFDAYFSTKKTSPVKKQAPKKDVPKKNNDRKKDDAKSKKHQSQAAILQMAEQAAKRAEEKAKKKAGQAPQARTKGEARHVDTRVNTVDLEKYNQKYEDIAPANGMGDYQKKQKLNQKSKQYKKKKPQGMHAHSKKETEAQRLARIAEQRKKQQIKITVPEEISVGDLASLLRMTATEVIKALMKLGMMVSVNEVIDYDTAEIVATELGAKVEKEVVVSIEEQIIEEDDENDENAVTRPPVVCVMGHVDHGKTSILDAIRNTSVTSTEAGGITQAIGAYQVETEDGNKITFLDTPGHAAFTAMRARGAMATDIAVLVVAADDGIMPQTVEAINHAKAAGVEIIVAINKMDREGANPDRIMQQLTEHELVPEEWGGDIICVPVSAKTKMGIDKLIETIVLVADMCELKANPDRTAKGVVIEAKLDKGRGPIATLLVQNGTLKSGDVIVAGTAVGKVRAMTDYRGKKLGEAGPSVPVEIMGLDQAPMSGDLFNAVSDEKLARQLVEQRKAEAKEEEFKAFQKVTLDTLFDTLQEGTMKELNIIVKADVQGSVEAVKQSLLKIENDEVRVKIIHGAVGIINESDVMLANASNAIIVGFATGVDPVAKDSAERDGVEIKTYNIIYDAIEDIENAMRGMRAPKYRDVETGTVEVREVFKISSAGTVAGSLVTSGTIKRVGKVRVIRNGKEIATCELANLKRFKDEVKEVSSGYECGITLKDFDDIRQGDILEAFIVEEYRD